ncbi:MAG: hypothetical protein OXB90_01290 [Acidimicrobiaceae bacterium]|nr:hypothetical protein [Acidimicrobiaceae bacterium]
MGGRGLAVHAEARLLADLADKTGLTAALSEAMASTKVRDRGHDRGRVLVDAAVLIADGGEAISDIAALGQQRGLFGVVASVSTLWRAFEVCLTLRDKLRVFSIRFGGWLVVVGFCVFGCRVLVLVLCGGSDRTYALVCGPERTYRACA